MRFHIKWKRFIGPLAADPAEIVNVEIRGGASKTISVTLRHGDSGWDHYADGWRVETEDGTILATRELLHPHVNEQPFTRSISGVVVPEGGKTLFIRARDNVEGWADKRMRIELNAS